MAKRLILYYAAAACLFLSGCAHLMDPKGDLDKVSREYNEMVRWDGREAACAAFADKALHDDCRKLAEAARDVKVADYRVVRVERDPSGKDAAILVRIEYYVPPSATVKTVEDLQQWRYMSNGPDRGWRLMSLPPRFE